MLNTKNIELRNLKLGLELKIWLLENHLVSDVQLFYNGFKYEWSPDETEWIRSLGYISNSCPYSSDDTLGLIFQGRFYEMLHEYPNSHPNLHSFYELFEKYGFESELTHTWSMVARPIDDN